MIYLNYIVYKIYAWPPPDHVVPTQKDLFEIFLLPTFESQDYKHWIAQLDLKTCLICRMNHGQIYEILEIPDHEPPIHSHCRCVIENMRAAIAGTATQEGRQGADFIVKATGKLPSNYISKQEAIDLGWVSWQGNLNTVAPGKSIGGNVYKNRNGHLPKALGRVWYEADINYDSGFRNTHRLLFSNDGLMFVTYDHYTTFVQIQ